jgi:hypothetical protein
VTGFEHSHLAFLLQKGIESGQTSGLPSEFLLLIAYPGVAVSESGPITATFPVCRANVVHPGQRKSEAL